MSQPQGFAFPIDNAADWGNDINDNFRLLQRGIVFPLICGSVFISSGHVISINSAGRAERYNQNFTSRAPDGLATSAASPGLTLYATPFGFGAPQTVESFGPGDKLFASVATPGAVELNVPGGVIVGVAIDTVNMMFSPSPVLPPAMVNLLEDGGRFSGSPEPQWAVSSSYPQSSWVVLTAAAVGSSGPKHVFGSSTWGGAGAAEDTRIQSLMALIKTSNEPRQTMPEFFAAQITATSTPDPRVLTTTTTHWQAVTIPNVPIPAVLTFGCMILVLSGSMATIGTQTNNRIMVGNTIVSTATTIGPGSGWIHFSHARRTNPFDQRGAFAEMPLLYISSGTRAFLALAYMVEGTTEVRSGLHFGIVPSYRGLR